MYHPVASPFEYAASFIPTLGTGKLRHESLTGSGSGGHLTGESQPGGRSARVPGSRGSQDRPTWSRPSKHVWGWSHQHPSLWKESSQELVGADRSSKGIMNALEM